MAWLALGAFLLSFAALGRGGKPAFDLTGALAAAALLVAVAGAWRVYTPVEALLTVALAAAAALLARKLLGREPPWLRPAALLSGAAAALFALLGPADGLF
ncbi:MAG TPA: hypothetical protein VF727_11965 [Allosphingosinicella sp.]|jgi:hypothetical protein